MMLGMLARKLPVTILGQRHTILQCHSSVRRGVATCPLRACRAPLRWSRIPCRETHPAPSERKYTLKKVLGWFLLWYLPTLQALAIGKHVSKKLELWTVIHLQVDLAILQVDQYLQICTQNEITGHSVPKTNFDVICYICWLDNPRASLIKAIDALALKYLDGELNQTYDEKERSWILCPFCSHTMYGTSKKTFCLKQMYGTVYSLDRIYWTESLY